LELILTRPEERKTLVNSAQGLRFLVLDELHTYRGRQGADVALLVRRVRNRLETNSQKIIFVGTSATLSTEGTFQERQAQVAEIGQQIFGASVMPQHIIGETLRRSTPKRNHASDLAQFACHGEKIDAPTRYTAFIEHPFSSWIEDTFGLQEKEGRLVRQEPCSVQVAGVSLSQISGVSAETCQAAIQAWLLAGYRCESDHITGFAPFAFRLHQFISPGNTVYAIIEHELARYITLNTQHFVPGDRNKVLFPLCFCRECGQEYYTVSLTKTSEGRKVSPREFIDQLTDDVDEAGYLYFHSEQPFPRTIEAMLAANRVPEDWLEVHKGKVRVRPRLQKNLPIHLAVSTTGLETKEGQSCTYIAAPFMFCLNCGISYAPRQSDFGKLATLHSEGRSSATTLLSLSAIRSLKTSDLADSAKKLLSFTDNRQDASLQAGHFNDFIEVCLLRGAIYKSIADAGEAGLSHEVIAEKVFSVLNLPFELYASNPEARFEAKHETEKALRQVLGYRIYRDLRRGWRIALPNLEQCGLLEITYSSLQVVCESEDVWADKHAALATAKASTRQKIARTLLDHMRRELAIKVDYLQVDYQERIRQWSNQRLIAPWAIDEDEIMETASKLLPRSSGGDAGRGNNTYVSAHGGFGMYLRRIGTFSEYPDNLTTDETNIIIQQLLKCLQVGGIVEVTKIQPNDDTPAYQLVASSMRWQVGKGLRTFHDPIRVPNTPQDGGKPNAFFVDFYRSVGNTLINNTLKQLEAHEHTAQVPYEEREERERKFRTGALPILYCSPTMELGVDIAELNVVNMRNVPPTPANYAQRSGRAGRSGQPALVFTYCASNNQHDQYFFKRPEQMVAGAVASPRLDLNNNDLLRAHLHAIWLAETGIDLRDTLKEILEMQGDPPALTILPQVRQQMSSTVALQKAHQRATQILQTIPDIQLPERFLDMTFQNITQAFDQTCDRWRELYWSAYNQVKIQENIRRDPTRQQDDKKQADRLRREALAQIDLLSEVSTIAQSDFYSYRYFATEGFLPGYSFPRLPLSAFIPARRTSQRDNFLSRPRFLAISEFGPRAIIYHEGSRYLIHQVIMPVTADANEGPLTTGIKQCNHCGYVHPSNFQINYDLCERCDAPLEPALESLLHLQNVVTRRYDRISADEEERLRMGYEIRTGVRFSERDGAVDVQSAQVLLQDQDYACLTYAQTATLWRINLGWTRRKVRKQYGFVLDVERGLWERNEQNEADLETPLSQRTKRVIPYVKDSRNCLIFETTRPLGQKQMASLQVALKRAIEALFQLEDNELVAEPLPDRHNRQMLLFFEAAEGGAGVLRRLVNDPQVLRRIAHKALEICHFDADGTDLHHAPHATEVCEAACYYCLLNYGNQHEHNILDRHSIRDVLLDLAQANVQTSPTANNRATHLDQLLSLCDSDLERDWLRYLHEANLRLPDDAQVYIENCQTRLDFVYNSAGVYVAVYIDGSHHDYAHQQARDRQQTDCLEDYGYHVIRFGYRDDWNAIIENNRHVFGGRS